ncbi:MAG: outer membrane lipoprotein-sorting protein [Candidatus Aminicenantes bacterium]|nr:outer membrane lipoprotein-sorting protein [Candidatus Aminicenantes bacterium]
MRKNRTILLVIFLIFLSAQFFSQIENSDKRDQEELEEILKNCAEYCERLSNAALHFVCKETIEEDLYHGLFGRPSVSTSGGAISVQGGAQQIEFNKYVYDYQLIKKGEKIEEARILLKENGKKKHEENAPLKTKRFYSKRSVYGPVGFLGKEQQDKFAYKIIEEQTIKKRKTYVIEVTPKINIEGNPNYGKVWIDKEDFSVLKIEIEQESLAGFEKIEQESKKQKMSPHITTAHDYFIEKNGIRFPSKTVCKESAVAGAGLKRRSSRISETRITYDSYRFFLVDVKIKY